MRLGPQPCKALGLNARARVAPMLLRSKLHFQIARPSGPSSGRCLKPVAHHLADEKERALHLFTLVFCSHSPKKLVRSLFFTVELSELGGPRFDPSDLSRQTFSTLHGAEHRLPSPCAKVRRLFKPSLWTWQ